MEVKFQYKSNVASVINIVDILQLCLTHLVTRR